MKIQLRSENANSASACARQTAFAGLYRLEVETNTAGESAHPSLSSHLAVSETLSKFIRLKGLLDLPALSAE